MYNDGLRLLVVGGIFRKWESRSGELIFELLIYFVIKYL